MNLSFIDWLIIFLALAGMFYSVNMSKGLMKSGTDFLSAGRTAGRYLNSVSKGVAGLGAISIISFLEVSYIGLIDLKKMISTLTLKERDHSDHGWVEK